MSLDVRSREKLLLAPLGRKLEKGFCWSESRASGKHFQKQKLGFFLSPPFNRVLKRVQVQRNQSETSSETFLLIKYDITEKPENRSEGCTGMFSSPFLYLIAWIPLSFLTNIYSFLKDMQWWSLALACSSLGLILDLLSLWVHTVTTCSRTVASPTPVYYIWIADLFFSCRIFHVFFEFHPFFLPWLFQISQRCFEY